MKKKRYIFAFLVPFILLSSLVLLFRGSPAKKSSEENKTPILERILPKSDVRNAVMAGSYYPSERDQLDKELKGYLAHSETVNADGNPRILIVPHAGIKYSGQVAASGFKQLEGVQYSKVIILGVSHKRAFPHVAVYSKGAWETPLGLVKVDEILADNLTDSSKGIMGDESSHREEHSLELELIFLQEVLEDFEIVPILIGQVDESTLGHLADKISLYFDEETLLIVSTDLSHYPDWETAQKIDGQTISAILSGSSETLADTVQDIESSGYPNVSTAACGHKAIWVALEIANDLGLKDFIEISRANSGDVTQDMSRVVGYCAIGIWGEELNSNTVTFDKDAQFEALEIARSTLVSFVDEGETPKLKVESEMLKKPLGAFVTLEKKGELRGCIGSFEPINPLYTVIQEMTISAASKDQRFVPVTSEELEDITVEISVMTPRKRIENWEDIDLGVQGVVIQKGTNTGTFLPQVATDTGWGLEKFLSELCEQKARLPRDCYKDPTAKIYTFEAQVFGEE